MPEDLAIINNESYDLGLQEVDEARIMQQKIMDLTRERDKKIEEAKIHLMVGIKVKTEELQNKLEICNRKKVYYHRIIGNIKQELQDNYHNIEEDKLRNKLLKNQQYLNLWIDKEEEIKRLLERLCVRYGHQIDTSKAPVESEIIKEKDDKGFVIGFEVLRYYVCKCCGEKILLDDHFTLKDWEWYHLLNAKFTKRIVKNEVLFEPSKLVLGKPKVILSNVDK